MNLHRDDGADPGEAVDHDADQGAVARPTSSGTSFSVPSSDVIAFLTMTLASSRRACSSLSNGVLPRLTTWLGPRTACAGVHRENLADDEERLDIAKLPDAVLLKPPDRFIRRKTVRWGQRQRLWP
jgi:hypothetical protein